MATSLNNLGALLSDTGRMAEAEGAHREALAIRRSLAGPEPAAILPDVAMSLNNLGALLRDTGRMAEAEGAWRESLDIYRSLAGPEPAAFLPHVAMSLNNLGNLLSDTGRMAEAEGALRESLDIYRSLAGPEPAAFLPDVADSLGNLGILLRATGRMDRAGDSFRLAAEARRLAKEAAEGWVDISSFLMEVDALMAASSRAQDSFVLGGGVRAEIDENPAERAADKVRKAIVEVIESNRAMRLRDALNAKEDVSASISAYADDVDPGDVLAVALVVRGFFRRRVIGYLCTAEALHSSFLVGSHIPFAEVRRVELAANGVRITPFDAKAPLSTSKNSTRRSIGS